MARQYRDHLRHFALFIVGVLVFGGFSGCGTVSYLLQAGRGQFEILNRSRKISDVIKDPKTSTRTKDLLASVAAIKAFGISQGLKPTQNYEEYVELNRAAVVWSVSACRELKFEPRRWSFPILGSVPYLGWFDKDRAFAYAEEVKAEGYEVDVRGVTAYSTLGWFPDPVVSTMLSKGETALAELVDVVLHESVHASFYISGQSTFNESLASFVAEHLTEMYLIQRHPASLESYKKEKADTQSRIERLHRAYDELSKVYESSIDDDSKRAQKKQILEKTVADLGYKRMINNAFLVQFKTYDTGGASFTRLLERCKGDWPCFWNRIKQLGEKSFATEQMEDFSPVIDQI